MSPSAMISQLRQLRRSIAIAIVAWTIVIAVSLFWNLRQQSHTKLTEFRVQVEAIHAMSMEYRNWIVHNGGVYVPITEKTPPSPWLSHVPDRDVTTPSGTQLTLLNSSYALRLVQEMMVASGAEARMHISSLNPANPINSPDPWERKALEAFNKGAKEVAAVDVMEDGKSYYRYIKPMVADSSCLKCHAKYGTKVGDIRGGVSVSIPIEPVKQAEMGERTSIVLGHGVIWCLGLLGLFIGGRRQQQAAIAVQASETQVTLLTNSIAHAIYGVDMNGRCTFANDACINMLGYTEQSEIFGKSMHELIHHTCKDGTPCPRESCPIVRSLENGTASYAEDELFWRKDGSSFPVTYWAYPVVLDGVVQGAVVTFIDITEQLQAKEELKRSRALLDSMVENIPAMVFLKQAKDLRFESLNLAGEKLLGHPRKDLIGKNDYDIFPKEQADSFTQKDRSVLESHRLLEIPEEPIKTADGSIRWLHTYKIGLYDEQNNPTHLLGVSVDISDRKLAQDQLRESEANLEEAQRMAHLGHWNLEFPSMKLTWSDEVYRIFEMEPQQFGGSYQAFLDAIHPDDRTMIDQAYRASLKDQVPYQIEHRLLMPDGRVKYILEKCETVFDADDNPVRSMGAVQDITTLKQAELALRDQQKIMEQTLEETIHTVSAAVELRDPYTAGHQRRVAELASEIARTMGLDEERIKGVRLGAMIHDIGKIGIPAEILSKPSQLTPLEIQVVHEHAEMGYNILKDVNFLWPIAEIAHQHHERMDGSGYPKGLKGDEILLEARIVAVADVIESMSSHRPYRPTLGIQAAVDEVVSQRGKRYDADVVDACLKVVKSGFDFS